ncbi:hypothetical protein SVIOM342S_01596 [Streptomyces violaceorubidus]
MFDDRETQTGASGGPGTGRVDAVEALEDALLVLSEMPMPWSVAPERGGGGHFDAGPPASDGALDGVAEGGGERAAAAASVQSRAGRPRTACRAPAGRGPRPAYGGSGPGPAPVRPGDRGPEAGKPGVDDEHHGEPETR